MELRGARIDGERLLECGDALLQLPHVVERGRGVRISGKPPFRKQAELMEPSEGRWEVTGLLRVLAEQLVAGRLVAGLAAHLAGAPQDLDGLESQVVGRQK